MEYSAEVMIQLRYSTESEGEEATGSGVRKGDRSPTAVISEAKSLDTKSGVPRFLHFLLDLTAYWLRGFMRSAGPVTRGAPGSIAKIS